MPDPLTSPADSPAASPAPDAAAAPSSPVTAAPEPAADSAREPGAESPGWLQGLFGRLRGRTDQEPDEAPSPEADAPSEPAWRRKPLADMTEEEKAEAARSDEGFRRVFQQEKDREIARERKAEADRKARELDEHIKDLLNPNSGNFDPYEGARLQAERDGTVTAEESKVQFYRQVGTTYDEAILTPIHARIPEEARATLLDGLPEGALDSRREYVTRALDHEYERGKREGAQEAEARLRKDPVFRKEVAIGRRAEDDYEEPEHLSGTSVAPTEKPDFLKHALSGARRR